MLGELSENRRVFAGLPAHVGLAKQWALRHGQYRLEAEVRYLADLLKDVNEIVREKRAHK